MGGKKRQRSTRCAATSSRENSEEGSGMGLEQLQGMDLAGMMIIEHRAGNKNVVGMINVSGARSDGSLQASWKHYGGDSRMTRFRPSCWECELVAGVIFLKRTAEDPPEDDSNRPWCDANLYTIFRQAQW